MRRETSSSRCPHRYGTKGINTMIPFSFLLQYPDKDSHRLEPNRSHRVQVSIDVTHIVEERSEERGGEWIFRGNQKISGINMICLKNVRLRFMLN